MVLEDFQQYSEMLHSMTADFVNAVPDDRWDFTPAPPGSSGRPPAEGRLGDGFAPFPKQLRHVVTVRGVYNDALRTGTLDWSHRHDYYTGPLTREALLEGLAGKQRDLIAILNATDPDVTIDWGGFPFSLTLFAGEFIQHESIHHGQWSVYAALGGFDTPLSWRQSWGL